MEGTEVTSPRLEWAWEVQGTVRRAVWLGHTDSLGENGRGGWIHLRSQEQ